MGSIEAKRGRIHGVPMIEPPIHRTVLWLACTSLSQFSHFSRPTEILSMVRGIFGWMNAEDTTTQRGRSGRPFFTLGSNSAWSLTVLLVFPSPCLLSSRYTVSGGQLLVLLIFVHGLLSYLSSDHFVKIAHVFCGIYLCAQLAAHSPFRNVDGSMLQMGVLHHPRL
jgi:hypothetical protein